MALALNYQVDRAPISQWRILVQNSRESSLFQTKDSFVFYSPLPFLNPFCFSVEEDNKLKAFLVGYIEKDGGKVMQLFSRRAIVNCGIFFQKEFATILSARSCLIAKENYKVKKFLLSSGTFAITQSTKQIFLIVDSNMNLICISK